MFDNFLWASSIGTALLLSQTGLPDGLNLLETTSGPMAIIAFVIWYQMTRQNASIQKLAEAIEHLHITVSIAHEFGSIDDLQDRLNTWKQRQKERE